MADDDQSSVQSKIYYMFIAVASAAVVVVLYHWIEGRCRRSRHQPPRHEGGGAADGGMESSTAELVIPAHKYRKVREVDGCGDDQDGTCAVCLCEFEDGEELRTLPKCMHSYHVECIDMWLYSHSNCPMCRTQATPPPQVAPPLSGLPPHNT